jgi:hypothetical protein
MWSLPWNPSGFFLGWGKNNLSAAPTTMLDLGAGNRRIEVHRFRERPSTSGWYISSFFSFEGINWAVQIYPGGQSKAENERYISIFLQQKSEAQTTVTCELRILDKFGNANGSRTFTNILWGAKLQICMVGGNSYCAPISWTSRRITLIAMALWCSCFHFQ